MNDFLIALGLVMVIEGFILALFPQRIQTLLKQMEVLSPDVLRKIGFIAVLMGAAWVWYFRMKEGL